MTVEYDVHALSGAYAVDAVDDLERTRFERHLAGCPDCRTEVDGLREAAAALSTGAEVAPPERMRERLLAATRTVRPLPPPVGPARSRRRRWRLPSAPVLVAAVLVLLIAIGGALWLRPWSDDTEPVGEPTTATEQVLDAPDATRVRKELPDGTVATVVLSRTEGRAVLLTEGMAPAPDGKVYEVWLQTPAGDMQPAGLMPDEPDATVLLDGDASEATGVGITVEPDGGSPAPTSDPILLFELDA